MVLLLEPGVQFGILLCELHADRVQNLERPANCEWVARHFKHVKELNNVDIHLMEFFRLVIGSSVQQRVVHGWVVDQVGEQELTEQCLTLGMLY